MDYNLIKENGMLFCPYSDGGFQIFYDVVFWVEGVKFCIGVHSVSEKTGIYEVSTCANIVMESKKNESVKTLLKNFTETLKEKPLKLGTYIDRYFERTEVNFIQAWKLNL